MRKIICVIIFIFLMLLLFAGCTARTENTESPVENNQSLSQNPQEGDPGEAEQTTDPVYTPDLPDIDFGGYEFKVYQRGPDAGEWPEVCIYAAEENGEKINDAVYKRNRIIEDRYNIEIVPVNGSGGIYDGQIKKGFENSILAGDNAFDMAMSGVYDSSLLARKGYLVDLYEIPYMDLMQPWWDISVNDSLTIMSRLYFGISRMGINDKDDSFCILFDKPLVQDLNIESPYQLVRDNKWTFDKMIELGKLAVTDLNGDGKMDANDRYGYYGWDSEAWCLYVASGELIASVGGDGIPAFTMLNERGLAVLEKIYWMLNEDNFRLRNTTGGMAGHESVHRILEQGQTLWAGAAMVSVQMARAMEKDFGMLPYPKFDASQDRHYTICGLWGPTAVTVPVTNLELDRTGIIIEAMVAEGMNIIYPAYYDINLVIKGLRDEESKEMLDIIMAGRRYDVGMLYNWGSMRDLLDSINGKSDSFVSKYEKKENSAIVALEKTVEEFKKVTE